jgi:hypothetical protein
LATNSFLLKGWSVVLVSALFALSAANSSQHFVLLAYIPAIVFWGLDGYFLSIERQYRDLYDEVRLVDAEHINFSMKTNVPKGASHAWAAATLSKTLIPFHGAIVGAIVIVMQMTG